MVEQFMEMDIFLLRKLNYVCIFALYYTILSNKIEK
jgi:hypothetical protein